jgi:hypothetical protein
MNKILIVFLVLCTMPALAKEIPPKVYIDKGACPFECCTYRDWTARKEIQLVAKPGGEKRVATLKKGETVKALTGEVHVVPTPMDVVFEHGRFKVGDRVYLLTYEGEGFQKVWSNGVITSEEVVFAYNLGNDDKSCMKPSADCWGRVQGKQQSTWWVKVQLKSGNVGWTKEADEFDNKDACG